MSLACGSDELETPQPHQMGRTAILTIWYCACKGANGAESGGRPRGRSPASMTRYCSCDWDWESDMRRGALCFSWRPCRYSWSHLGAGPLFSAEPLRSKTGVFTLVFFEGAEKHLAIEF